MKTEIQSDEKNRWNLLLLNQDEFDDNGQFVSLGNVHNFNEDWFSNISLGFGGDGFFLPEHRIDAFINRKWLDRKQLITTLGIGEYDAMDVHEDKSVFLGATYYFETPWIVQGGVRFNESDPGS